MSPLAAVNPQTSSPISPARNALARHLAWCTTARSALAEAHKPNARLRPQLEAAQAALRDSQADLDAILKFEADDLASWAKSGIEGAPAPRTGERQAAESKLAEAKRTVGVIQAAINAGQPAIDTANAALAHAEGQTGNFVLNVIREEFANRLQTLEAARTKAWDAEIRAGSLIEAISERGRNAKDPAQQRALLEAAQRFVTEFRALPVPAADARKAQARWAGLIDRLTTDATVTLEQING